MEWRVFTCDQTPDGPWFRRHVSEPHTVVLPETSIGCVVWFIDCKMTGQLPWRLRLEVLDETGEMVAASETLAAGHITVFDRVAWTRFMFRYPFLVESGMTVRLAFSDQRSPR